MDWVIVIVYPLISLAIGIFVNKFVKNMNDFVCAGRGLGTALGVATLSGTELGLITVMYCSQKAFHGGFATFHIALLAGMVTFTVGISGFFIYRLRKMKVLTIPEFYERRFNKRIRVLGGIMMAAGGILNMGLFLKISSMFIIGVTGLSESSWALPTVMIFLTIVVLAYTCLGGMVSVVIADYVQFVVLSFGILLATYLAINNLGWDNIFHTVAQVKKEAGFNPVIEESGFGIEYILFVCFLGIVSSAIWPTSVARSLAAYSPKTAKKQCSIASISFMIRFLIPNFWGICAFVWITNQGGVLKEAFFPSVEGVKAVDDLYAMPMFFAQILPAGFIGIITAAMLAAFMSTQDSYLLCWSSVLTQDVIAPLMGDRLTPQKRILITRILIVVIGLYVLGWGLLYKGSLDVFDYMGVTGAIYYAGAFALLFGGLYWKRASSTGAFMALLAGFSAILGLSPVQGLLHITLSPARATLFSIFLTTAALFIGSLLFPDKRNKAGAVNEIDEPNCVAFNERG